MGGKELTKEQRDLRFLAAEAIDAIREDICWADLVMWSLGYIEWDDNDFLVQRCRSGKSPHAYCGKCKDYFETEKE